MTSLALRLPAAVPLAMVSISAAPARDVFHYRLDPAHSDISARVSFFGIASKTAQLQGELTARGITRPVMLAVTFRRRRRGRARSTP